MQFIKRNPFGHILFIKKWIIRIIGAYSHRRYRGFNELKIEGSEIIRDLKDSNVLFISNHQTYFADVVAMFHVFNASLKGRVDSIKNIMEQQNHRHIDLLKLDIEGAEIETVNQMLDDKIYPTYLLIEFDLLLKNKDPYDKTKKLISRLILEENYTILKNDNLNITFVRNIYTS